MQLHRAREKFEAAGVEPRADRPADPAPRGAFRRRQGIELPVLADESRASYKAAGAKVATLGELLGPKVVAKSFAATAKTGRVQTKTIGHPAQLGGAMLIAHRRDRRLVAHGAGRQRQRLARGDPRGGAGARLTSSEPMPEPQQLEVVAPFAATVIAIAHERRRAGRRRHRGDRARGDEDGARGARRARRRRAPGRRAPSATRSRRASCSLIARAAGDARRRRRRAARATRRPSPTSCATTSTRCASATRSGSTRRARRRSPSATSAAGAPRARTSPTSSTRARSSSTGRCCSPPRSARRAARS